MNAVKIICDQCGAKHQIGAEKLQDIQKKETFKIRCKNCAQPIVVQTKTLFADQTSQPQVANHAQPVEAANENLSENAQWFAMIQDQQQGPFVLKQLRAKWAQSVIDQSTYVWREGLDGWQMISQLPELQSVWKPTKTATPAVQAKPVQVQVQSPIQLQPAQDEMPATKAFAQQSSPFAQFAGTPKPEEPKLPASQTIGYGFDQQSELASDLYAQRSKNLNKNTMSLEQAQPMMQQQAQPFVQTQQAQPFAKSDDDDLLSSVKAPLLQASESNQSSPEASFKLKNQRNENSVLFSLESLEGGKSDIKILNANADREASGLIDLSSLGDDLSVVSKPIQFASNRTLITKQNQSFQTVAIVLVSLFSISGLVLGSLWIYNTYLNPAQKNDKIVMTSNIAQNTQMAQNTSVDQQSNQKQMVGDQKNMLASQETQSANQTQASTDIEKKKEKSTSEPAEKKKIEKAEKAEKAEKVEKVEKVVEKVEPKKTIPTPVASNTKSTTNVNDLLKNLRGGGGGGGTATPPPVIGSSNSNRDDLLEKLGKSDVLGSIQPQIPNVKRCSDRDPSLTGTVKVKIQVANTGNVTDASVENDPFAGTPVGSCVERVVKGIKFPAFSNPSMSFTFPFALP